MHQTPEYTPSEQTCRSLGKYNTAYTSKADLHPARVQ